MALTQHAHCDDPEPLIEQIAGGTAHSLILKTDGSVWAVGRNNLGQFGNGNNEDQTSPEKVVAEGVIAIAAGGQHSLIIKADHSLLSTGYNSNGQLGNGANADINRFVPVISDGVVSVAANHFHSIALKDDGSVWTTGYNLYGQLGNGTTAARIRFEQVLDSGALAVAAGGQHSLVLLADGTVLATGYNRYGQLGDGTKIDRTSFSPVDIDSVVGVAAGFYHSLFVKADGSLWAAGQNSDGQLGVTTANNHSTPVKVIDSGVVRASGGFNHTLFTTLDGAVFGMGSNEYGQLGDRLLSSRATPKPIYTYGVIAGVTGRYHTLFLQPDRSLWATGKNESGQLGDGTKIDRHIPIQSIPSTLAAPNLGLNFQAWLEAIFSPEEIEAMGDAAETTDSDSDGFSNLQEFALGLDPKNFASRLDLRIASRPQAMTLALRNAHPHFNYALLASEDFKQWEAVGPIVPLTNGTAVFVVAQPQPRRFYTIQVSEPVVEFPHAAPTPAEFAQLSLGRTLFDQAYTFSDADNFTQDGKSGKWLYSQIDADHGKLVFTYTGSSNQPNVYREEIDLEFTGSGAGTLTWRRFESDFETETIPAEFNWTGGT